MRVTLPRALADLVKGKVLNFWVYSILGAWAALETG